MKIYVAGGTGMVGQAVTNRLRRDGHEVFTPRVDLRRQHLADNAIREIAPDVVINAAATVGGIRKNIDRPADMVYDNLMIQANLIESCRGYGVNRVVLLGSSCIYPAGFHRPIVPSDLLSAPLEPTNEFYAIAKIAGIKMGEAYARQYGMDIISLMPCNLYGPGDTYSEQNSHVIPAMIMKFYYAMMRGEPEVRLWGDGHARREFLHVNDLAEAVVLSLDKYHAPTPLNVGYGADVPIFMVAEAIRKVVGYPGRISWDSSQPSGVARKLMDSSVIANMGWAPTINLSEGLNDAYRDFLRRYTK